MDSLPFYLRNYFTAWALATRDSHMGRASGGLLSIVKNKFKPVIIDISHWWCIIRISCGSWSAIIASFYFSPARDLAVLLELFQPILDDILDRFSDDIIV